MVIKYLSILCASCIIKVIREMASFPTSLGNEKRDQNTKGDFSMVKLYDGGVYLVKRP